MEVYPPYGHPDYLSNLSIGKHARLKVRALLNPYPATAFVIHGESFKQKNGLDFPSDVEWVPAFGFPDCLVNPQHSHIVSLRTGREVPTHRKDENSDRLKVRLWLNGKQYCVSVHKIVYTSVYGPLQPGFEIHHKGACTQNQIENLVAVTKEEHFRLTTERAADLNQFIKDFKLIKTPQYGCAEVDPDNNIIRQYKSYVAAARAVGRPVRELRMHLNGHKDAKTFAGGYWIPIDIDGTRLERVMSEEEEQLLLKRINYDQTVFGTISSLPVLASLMNGKLKVLRK